MDYIQEEREDFIHQRENGVHARERRTGQSVAFVRQLLAVLSGAFSFVSTGFHLAWPSPSFVKLFAEDSDISVTSAQGGWIVSCIMPGAVFGLFLSSFLVDRWGRKPVILLSALFFGVSCIFIGLAQTYWWLYVARFFAGIGWGLSSVSAIIYLGEVAENRFRGNIGALFNCMVNGGILLAYAVGPWLDRKSLAGVGGAIAVILFLAFFWMPESPCLLVMKKRMDEAEKSLMWLRHQSDVNEELKIIERSVEFEQKYSGSYKELLLSPNNRRAMILGFGLSVSQEMSGVAAITAYSQLIFEASGARFDSSICSIVVGTIQLVAGYLATFTFPLAGRRPLFLTSLMGICFFLSVEAVYFQLRAAGVDLTSVFWLPVSAMIGYVLAYALGLGVVTFGVLSEIFPCNIKAKAIMLMVLTVVVGTAVVGQVYQIVSDAYGVHYSFWLFALLSACSTIFVYFYLPETRGKSLQEIQNILRNRTPRKLKLSTFK